MLQKKLKTKGIKAMLKYLKEFRIISLSISIVLSFLLILFSDQILKLFMEMKFQNLVIFCLIYL